MKVARTFSVLAALLGAMPSTWAQAAQISCKVTADVLARELVELQLNGFALDPPSHCMNPKEYKYVKVHILGTQEAPRDVQYRFEEGDRYKLGATTTNEDGNLQTVVHWSWAKPDKKPATSTFLWTRYDTPKVQKELGCARILSPWSDVIVRPRIVKCLND